jgi:hypothetical protein
MAEPLPEIADQVFLSLEHPLQPRRFALALFFALILFPLIAAGLVAGTVFLIVPLIAFLLWMSGRVLFAHFMGNSILVSELNYPRIRRIGENVQTAIGYEKIVNIFVYEQGDFNAYLMKFFFFRRAVFVNSELLEEGVTDDELRWLIGRFIGYLRARRQAGFWGWTIRAAQHLLVFNLFLLPYERALVYTGDRIALAVISGDISSAISAMQKLFVGRELGYSVNPNGMVDQHRQVKGSIFAFFARLLMPFPQLTARYVDLIGFAKERYPVQFERFEAENPGLPADLRQLTALPQADVNRPAVKDPVWAPLAGAVALLALLTFSTVKVMYSNSSNFGSSPETYTPVAMESPTSPPPAAAPESDTPTAGQQLQPYVSTVGRFSVLFPGTPKQNSRQVTLSDSDSVTLHQFQFEDGNSSYIVMYNDYPAQYVATEPQSFLKIIRDGTMEPAKGTLTSDQRVDLKGVPGRTFQFTDQAGNTYAVLVLIDHNRLYQVIVTAGPGTSATNPDDFLNSFHIL